MRKLSLMILMLAFLALITACASSYKTIGPNRLSFNSPDSQAGIDFSYKYDVLREAGNKKYAKKESKKGVRLIAVKITNNSDSVLNIGSDIDFYAGEKHVFPMDPVDIKNSIKQIVPGYLPYLLLTFVNLTVYDGNTVDVIPIGLVLGPGITAGNMIVAGTANTKLQYELEENNIMNKEVEPGETVYGIIGIRNTGYDPVTIKIIK